MSETEDMVERVASAIIAAEDYAPITQSAYRYIARAAIEAMRSELKPEALERLDRGSKHR